MSIFSIPFDVFKPKIWLAPNFFGGFESQGNLQRKCSLNRGKPVLRHICSHLIHAFQTELNEINRS
jgi:hypothetical protein